MRNLTHPITRHTAASRAAISDAMKLKWADPKWRASHRGSRVFTPEMDAVLIKMWLGGATQQQCAKRCGVAQTTVHARLLKLGYGDSRYGLRRVPEAHRCWRSGDHA